jgi:hypothetical protein
MTNKHLRSAFELKVRKIKEKECSTKKRTNEQQQGKRNTTTLGKKN